ncbi:MAG: hypothetical protein O2945_17370 [Planctomycetota bacterium]|nr:hypothetical protein [Planctomycetota bacterium]MDA0920844.1 hypothetical protein [Planctomycetota bacterium]
MRLALAAAAFIFSLNCLTVRAEEIANRRPSNRRPRSVTAILNDGRQIFGRVAATTNDERLDLVAGSERVQLTAHLNWDQVVAIETGRRQVSVERFRRQLAEFTLPAETSTLVARQPRKILPLLHDDSDDSQSPSRKIPRSLQIDARLTSWDKDAQPDGLLLELFVLDETGHPTVVPGQLTATLTGLRQQITGGQETLNRKPPTAQLERWSMPIRVSDFADGRASVKLPFRNLQPDRDLSIASETLLEISYGVSSVGVLKVSQPDVQIRRSSLFRDELFLSTGNRQLPSEGPAPPTRRPLSRDPHREIFRPTFQVR